MRLVLDTDVASGLIKGNLPAKMLARIAPHEPALTFVAIGELTRWMHTRQLGERRTSSIMAFMRRHPVLPAGGEVAATWGEIIAYADRRGRPRPVNDSWVAACCLTYSLPLATFNVRDFRDFSEHEGLRLLPLDPPG